MKKGSLGKRRKKRLQQLYYNPRLGTGFGGKTELEKKVKFPVEDWLAGQEAYTLHKPVSRRFLRRRVVSLGINFQWEADLADLSLLKKFNDNYSYLVCVIDVFSKRAGCVAVRKKTASEVAAAFGTLLDSKSMYPEIPVFQCRTDRGTEFKGEFKKICKEYRIHHFFSTNPETHSSVVERFIRTLKNRIFRYLSHKKTKRYIDQLPKFLESYNNRKHSSHGMVPMQVNLKNQNLVRERLYGTRSFVESLRNPTANLQWSDERAARKLESIRKRDRKFPLNSRVRISKYKNPFAKGYHPNFTREIFYIDAINGQRKNIGGETIKSPALFTIRDQNDEIIEGKFYSAELVKVH